MTFRKETEWLSNQPRFPLGHWPTPLEPLDRLSEELGGPRIWVKRDDCTGLGLGGNKTRKLEFLLGDALAQGYDCVVTFGAIQSNHARQTAAACAKAGLPCHLVLSRQVKSDAQNYESSGNVMLDKLFGAQLHLIEADDSQYARELLTKLRTDHKVYVIPGGGSNAVGAMGYAACALELIEQCTAQQIELKHVMHASSSAGTQAGLIYGFGATNLSPAILGINVYHDDPATLKQAVQHLVEKTHEHYSDQSHPPKQNPSVSVNHAYYGQGYGQPTPETLAAIHLLATQEGLLFDPVYSGKALAALVDQISVGAFSDSRDVILIHTGGMPSLFVYEKSLGTTA